MKTGIAQCKENKIGGLYEKLLGMSYADVKELAMTLEDAFFKYHPELYRGSANVHELKPFRRLTGIQSFSENMSSETLRGIIHVHFSKVVAEYSEFFNYAKAYKQNIRVLEWHFEYALLCLGNKEKAMVIPSPWQYLDFQEDRDYTNIAPADLQQTLLPTGAFANHEGISLFGSGGNLSCQDVQEQLSDTESRIASLQKEEEDVKNAKVQELAEIQAKIDAMKAALESRKQAMLLDLEEKKEKMAAEKEKLENQIYLLDSQIFAIRCYAGETVQFAAIRTGKAAPVTVPVVVHQKLRFLDEELGKLTALYSIRWDEIRLFEDFLKHSQVALDTFAPNERCVVLIRLSRTGKVLAPGSNRGMGFKNILEAYDYWHGKTIGILIRNGENLYLGWTDEDRIHIDDDFVNNVIDCAPPEKPDSAFFSEYDEKQYQQEVKRKKKKAMDDVLSRYFVVSILQGIVDNSNILPMPEGVRFDKPSEYIQYSLADSWLDDGRYGSFTDILDRCNKSVKVGDMVLTVQHLVPEQETCFGRYASPYRAWSNSRGRGEANRTHDCSVKDCELYAVNLVESDEPVKMVRYREKVSFLGKEEWSYGTMSEESWDSQSQNGIAAADPAGKELVERYEDTDTHVYVSVEKQESYYRSSFSSRPARANFELYPAEYINLTFMNSVWLTWVITQRKLGNWRVGGKTVDYAYAIRYLNKALEYVRHREEKEKALIDAVDDSVCQNTEWPVKLSEWKMSHGVRSITPYQAKRFVRAVQTGKR